MKIYLFQSIFFFIHNTHLYLNLICSCVKFIEIMSKYYHHQIFDTETDVVKQQ